MPSSGLKLTPKELAEGYESDDAAQSAGFSSSKGSAGRSMCCRRRLTNRWSGRVKDKVPSSYVGARAAQLNR